VRFLKVVFILWMIMGMFSPGLAQAEESRILRYPDIHKDKIVFVHAGDLWLVNAGGGIARRLTSDDGFELFPKFSPGGDMIAFTGQYDGNTDVYVIPAKGGEPKRLTFCPGFENQPDRFGFEDMVSDWHPDGKSILFRSWRESYNSWFQTLFLIDIEGGYPVSLPLPEAGLTCFSPDASKIAYNRTFRNFRTWKRYQGGLAQDIWTYDFDQNEVERITDWEGTDTSPMWYNDKIYFVSDRDRTANIFCYDLGTKQTRKITSHNDFDVKWPSLGPEHIVYEQAGYLWVLDLKTEQAKRISVQIPDDKVLVRPEFVSVKDHISEYDLSPGGKRAVFAARGEIFTVPAEKGNTRNLTNTSRIREKNPVWSLDGKWIAYMSDRTGEDELYIVPQDGKGEEIRITRDGHCYRFAPVWSPDSKKLLFADKDLKLYYLDIEEKQVILVDSTKNWEIKRYSWSPDSRWIAYAKPAKNHMSSIFLYSLDQKSIFRVTDDFTDDTDPVFDREGKFLYFLSQRDFNAALGEFEPSFTYNQMTKIYVVTLQADSLSPFAPESDEAESPEERWEKKKGERKKWEEEKPEAIEQMLIDIEGIGERVMAFPIDPGEISGLRAAKQKIFYLSFPRWTLTGRKPGPQGKLHLYDLEKREDHILLSPVDGYALSADESKIIYKSGKQYGIVDAKPGGAKVGDGALKLDQMEMRLDRREEWAQIFGEVWRRQRDFFYAPNMHGVDWDLLRDRYGELLPFVAHRTDLNYILGEMISELCCSHTYLAGGEGTSIDVVKTGLLGIDWEPDKVSGFYRIKKIYPGKNWRENLRSPLTEPGVEVKEGEYIVAVNGKTLKSPTNPYSLFENTVGKTVMLKVNSKPSLKDAREVTVKPIGSEYRLRYRYWVESNRRKVEEATNGKVGYIFIPDMGGGGLNEFAESFFPQIRKQGLIVDVRYNGGGFVSEMILERLRRKVVGMGCSRNAADYPHPGGTLYGHMVCIANQYSASDGDNFPYYFREYGLGPVIGRRTWGGVVGIRGFPPLLGGGYVTAPEFAPFSMEGEWIMENYGVDPDIEVDNLPNQVISGRDPQLEKAIEVIVRKLEEDPRELPERPPYPFRK
jgi:tricorn protease